MHSLFPYRRRTCPLPSSSCESSHSHSWKVRGYKCSIQLWRVGELTVFFMTDILFICVSAHVSNAVMYAWPCLCHDHQKWHGAWIGDSWDHQPPHTEQPQPYSPQWGSYKSHSVFSPSCCSWQGLMHTAAKWPQVEDVKSSGTKTMQQFTCSI